MHPAELAAKILAPAHHPAPSFHLMGMTHHFTSTQGAWILILAVAAIVAAFIARLVRS